MWAQQYCRRPTCGYCRAHIRVRRLFLGFYAVNGERFTLAFIANWLSRPINSLHMKSLIAKFITLLCNLVWKSLHKCGSPCLNWGLRSIIARHFTLLIAWQLSSNRHLRLTWHAVIFAGHTRTWLHLKVSVYLTYNLMNLVIHQTPLLSAASQHGRPTILREALPNRMGMIFSYPRNSSSPWYTPACNLGLWRVSYSEQ